MKFNTTQISKKLIYLCLILIIQACGPAQEELKIGALKHFNRGNQHMANNQPKAAISEYSMAVELDPSQERIYYNMGLAYYRLVLFQQAIDSYWKAIKQKSDFGEAWYNLALAFDKIGETEKAFIAYEKYHKLNNPQIPEKPSDIKQKPE